MIWLYNSIGTICKFVSHVTAIHCPMIIIRRDIYGNQIIIKFPGAPAFLSKSPADI